MLENCKVCAQLTEELVSALVVSGATFFESASHDIDMKKCAVYAGAAFFGVLAVAVRARYKAPPTTPTIEDKSGDPK